jgi:hypothetical protein
MGAYDRAGSGDGGIPRGAIMICAWCNWLETVTIGAGLAVMCYRT